MTATKAAPSTYQSGHCSSRAHERCRGVYSGTACTCTCHTAPPRLEVGARVVCAPGTRWAGEDLTGQVLEVVQVQDYPTEVGGPVFVCRWPGTTATTGACLQADQITGGTP